MEESGYKTEVRLRGLAGKSRVLKPAQTGFVCVAAVSTALLRMVQDLSLNPKPLKTSEGEVRNVDNANSPAESCHDRSTN